MIAAIWSRVSGYVVALGAVLALLVGAVLKGRADATRNAELKDLRDANEIRRDGAAARAGADPDRMRSDGWRRD